MESPFRVGAWLVEPLGSRLVRGEVRQKLDPKVMQVLVYLAERPNGVALKEEILASVWEGMFVADEVLTNAVWELRKALGDDAKDPQYVQTVPRKGYRLIAPVHLGDHEPPVGKTGRPAKLWVTIAGLAIAAAASWYVATNESPTPQPRVSPLTGYRGAEWWPALSPDGERVAFVWDGGEPGPSDLYVRGVGSGNPLRLTETDSHEYSPAWSPDGGQIAFLRQAGGNSDVVLIPSLGGFERTLSTLTGTVDSPENGRLEGLGWSPDGRWLAVSDRSPSLNAVGVAPGGAQAIFLLSVDSGEKRQLSSPSSNGRGDMQPAFSPDGKTLAFVRRLGLVKAQLYLQPLAGNEPALLADPNGFIGDLDWTADGSAILFEAGTESEAGSGLFRVPATGGTPERLAFGEQAYTISIARKAARLVYDRRSGEDTDIWRLDGPAAEARSVPERLIASSRIDWAPEFSPDGTQIAFTSERAGNNNIWVCASDGTRCFQLTDLFRASHPYWSPDGKQLVHNGREGSDDAHPNLYVTEIEGGLTRRLTEGYAGVASWSPDGERIYFDSNQTGEWQVWKIAAAGGDAVPVTRDGGVAPSASGDGNFLYYCERETPCGIRRISVEGGESVPVVEVPNWSQWTLWESSIIYVSADGEHLESFDVETRERKRLFSKGPSWSGLSFRSPSVSPDGRSVLVSRSEPQKSDIMLVEGFR